MLCAILRGNSRLVVNTSTRMCTHPSVHSYLHPVLRAPVVRYSSSSGTCSGPEPKSGIQPVSLSDRTINLAHQASYTSAKKPPCLKSPTSPACPKSMKALDQRYVPESRPVRKCTVQDLSQKCPPPKPVCPCPEKPLTMMEMVGKTIIFFIKAVIVAGLVYWTIDIGVWGDSTESGELFKEMQSKVMAMMGMKPADVEVKELPKTDHMYHNALVTWNRGVVMTFEVITTTYNKIAGMFGFPPEGKN